MILYPPASPVIAQLGPIAIRWYGVLIACAIFLSYYLALQQAKKDKIAETKFDSIFLISVASGLIGARLAFIIQDLDYYVNHIVDIFKLTDGGLSIHGALILGLLGLYLASRIYKINFLQLANILAPYLLLSGAIGRWGNYFNQEIIGKPSDYYLKLFVDAPFRPELLKSFEYFHPVFLYESLLLFVAFIVFISLRSKLQNRVLAYTLISYSLIRIVVEFFRVDYKPILLSLDLAQLVSFGIITLTVVLSLTFRKK